MNNLKHIFIFLLCFSCLSHTAAALSINGSISSLGVVQENARIDIGDHHTFSNINGSYDIHEIPEGSYILSVRKIGFNDLIQEITLNSNQTCGYHV